MLVPDEESILPQPQQRVFFLLLFYRRAARRVTRIFALFMVTIVFPPKRFRSPCVVVLGVGTPQYTGQIVKGQHGLDVNRHGIGPTRMLLFYSGVALLFRCHNGGTQPVQHDRGCIFCDDRRTWGGSKTQSIVGVVGVLIRTTPALSTPSRHGQITTHDGRLRMVW